MTASTALGTFLLILLMAFTPSALAAAAEVAKGAKSDDPRPHANTSAGDDASVVAPSKKDAAALELFVAEYNELFPDTGVTLTTSYNRYWDDAQSWKETSTRHRPTPTNSAASSPRKRTMRAS